MSESRKVYGKIDILVCNAAANPYYGPLKDLPDDRKNAVRAYWLSQIAASGGIGKTVAKAIQPQQEAA